MLTPEQQRAQVSDLLRRVNRPPGNHFNGAASLAYQGRSLDINSDFHSYSISLDRYIQAGEAYKFFLATQSAPSDVPELAELIASNQRLNEETLQLLRGLRSAFQATDITTFQQLSQELLDLHSESTLGEMRKLQETLLARFNIPDAEVSYERRQGAKGAEWEAVQTAMNAMMADRAITAVNPQTVPTNDFSALPTGAGAKALSAYLQSAQTVYRYTWNAQGQITGQSD